MAHPQADLQRFMFAQPKRATTIAQQGWPLVSFDDASLIKRRFYQSE
jgi:hypothetical protein